MIVGGDLQHRTKMIDRLLVLVFAREQHGKIVVRVGLCRVEANGFFKLFRGALWIAELRERGAKVHARCKTVRLRRDGFTKLSRCFRIPSRLERDLAATEI